MTNKALVAGSVRRLVNAVDKPDPARLDGLKSRRDSDAKSLDTIEIGSASMREKKKALGSALTRRTGIDQLVDLRHSTSQLTRESA
jgi:hypothetical protein